MTTVGVGGQGRRSRMGVAEEAVTETTIQALILMIQSSFLRI